MTDSPLLAIQMDPPETLRPATDTTLRLALEAQRRGYHCVWYHPSRLTLGPEGNPVADAEEITFHDNAEHWFTRGEPRRLSLNDARVVLMRQDPPFDMGYITACHMLETLKGRVLVANDPAWVRNLPEKLFPFEFREFMPPTLISADMEEIKAFRKAHGAIVIKPLYGHGGRSVFLLEAQDVNLAALMETLLQQEKLPVMVQPFLPDVRDKELRIVLIDGEVAAAMVKIPASGEIRSNLRHGSTVAAATLTPRQQAACEAFAPVLRKRGLLLAGIDMIGDYLTEINITSPTGLPALNRLHGLKLEASVWDAIERRL